MSGPTPDLPRHPPADLAQRTPMLSVLPMGAILHRYFTKFAKDGTPYDPINFSASPANRFDNPAGAFRVLYAAASEDCCFAECFLRGQNATLLSLSTLRRYGYVQLALASDLNILHLHGAGLARLGANAEISSSPKPYDAPQAWSAAIHAAFPDIHGLAYRSRHDNDHVAYAIFDRVHLIGVADRHDDLDTDDFWRMAERYSVGMAP